MKKEKKKEKKKNMYYMERRRRLGAQKLEYLFFKHTVCTFQGYLHKEHINAVVYILLKCANSMLI